MELWFALLLFTAVLICFILLGQAVRIWKICSAKNERPRRPRNVREFASKSDAFKQIVIRPFEIEWWSAVISDSLYKLIHKEINF